MNINELMNSEDRNDDWVKQVVGYIISDGVSSFREQRERDQKCWKIYHGIPNNEKFKYLTDVEGMTYPAKFRNIGNEIVRSKLNILESKQARRIFRFKAFAMDQRSLAEKRENRVKAFVKSVKEMYEERSAMLEFQIQQVHDRMNDMQEQLNAQPESEEMQLQIDQLRANMPLIQLEFNKIIRALSRETLDNNELSKKIDYFLLNTDQEIMQQVANAAVKSAIQSEDLQEHWNVGLKEKITTGRPTYIVYYDKNRQDVIFRQIDATAVCFDKSGNNKWSQNGEYCFTEEYMSDSQIRSEFELTQSQSYLLTSYISGDYESLKNYYGNTAQFDTVGESNSARKNGHRVQRVWFLAPREVFYKKSPNKHVEDGYFVNLSSKNEKIKKGEEKRRVIIYDMYHAVVINGSICLNFGKQNEVFRPLDTPGLPTLPVVARTFNSNSEKPYSLIWRVRELIELYDIINYKKELTIALAGVRGMVMDKSQKPDNMSEKKWMYYRKMGTMWIETIKKNRKTPASYNQFQNYDDSISEGILSLDAILIGLEQMIGKIMGITDAAQGQFVSKDPVANVKLSNEQSSLISEILYYENDAVFNKALELYTNLKIRFVWNKGRVLNHINEDLEETIINIPSGMLDGADYRFYTTNNIKEDTMLEDLRQGAFQAWSRSELPFSSIISIFKVEDLKELENTLIHVTKEAEEIRQMNASSLEESKEQAKQKTNQLKAELDSQLLQMSLEVENARNEIEKAKIEFDTQKFAWESQFKEKELQLKTNLETMRISSENNIESSYLEEEGRANRTNEMLKQFELKINAILQEMSIRSGESQSIRKASVDIDKNMRNKNNIKD